MKSIYTVAALALVNAQFALAGDATILPPPASASGDDVAIVWIHGMKCDNDAYIEFANEIQSQGAKKNQKIWVGLP